jgi:uracil-DNA glycosylase family 4
MTDSLVQVAADVSGCRACPRLVDWREKVAAEKRASYRDWDYWGRGVPALGVEGARIVVVGLAPAAHGGNRTGRIFTGDRSGDWLYRALWRAGLANQPTSTSIGDGLEVRDTLITAPVKCAPPDNKPLPSERDTCRPFLQRELALADPAVYVALGGFAFGVLCAELGIRPRPKFGHGVEVEVPGGATLLGCYHVSQQNTFTGKLTEAMLDAVFARARELADLAPVTAPGTSA